MELINIENVYPSPSSDFVNIIYTVSEPSVVSLKIYDIVGKEVLKIVDDEFQKDGRYKAIIDLNELSSGMYFYELSSTGGKRIMKKFMKK